MGKFLIKDFPARKVMWFHGSQALNMNLAISKFQWRIQETHLEVEDGEMHQLVTGTKGIKEAFQATVREKTELGIQRVRSLYKIRWMIRILNIGSLMYHLAKKRHIDRSASTNDDHHGSIHGKAGILFYFSFISLEQGTERLANPENSSPFNFDGTFPRLLQQHFIISDL